jgi:hypothetical protein
MREVTTILVQVQAFSGRASNAFDNADAIGHAAELCFWAAKATAADSFSIIYSSPEAHTLWTRRYPALVSGCFRGHHKTVSFGIESAPLAHVSALVTPTDGEANRGVGTQWTRTS